jgi:hypothetical protein
MDPGEGVIRLEAAAEEGEQFTELAGKVLDPREAVVALEGDGRPPSSPGPPRRPLDERSRARYPGATRFGPRSPA